MMLQFKPDLPADGTILCLGAHCDDIERCGGTLIELHKRHPGLRRMLFSGDEVGTRRARLLMRSLSAGAISTSASSSSGQLFSFDRRGYQRRFETLRGQLAGLDHVALSQ